MPAVLPLRLQRRVGRFPYVPSDPASRDERCAEVYSIQVQALVQRMRAAGIEKLKGHPLFAHVTLTRSERSPIAALVTDLLESEHGDL